MIAFLRILAAGVIGGALALIIAAAIVFLVFPGIVALIGVYAAMMDFGFRAVGWWFVAIQLGVLIGVGWEWDRLDRPDTRRDDVGLGG